MNIIMRTAAAALAAAVVLAALGGLATAEADRAAISHAVPFIFASGPGDFSEVGTPVEGARSQLVRHEGGVSMTFQTHGLAGGDAYTVWWVIFNDPSQCSAPGCDEDDLFVNPADPSQGIDPNGVGVWVGYAAGHVVGDSGRASFAAGLSAGDTSGTLLGTSAGLDDPFAAEVHLVLRRHGPALTGQALVEQITTFGGGCSTMTGGTDPAGFDCYDPQAAMHLP
jgi:hypothetical protein